MANQAWLADMQLFIAVARARNFTRAATALDMPTSSLSRRLSDLERTLGFRLLNRSTRCVEITEDGEKYLFHAERIVEYARVMQDDLHERIGKPVGVLRVSLPESLAHGYAIRWFAQFAGLYPDLSLQIDTGPDYISPLADNFDICIHNQEVSVSSLTIRRLATFDRILVAAPAYLAERGTPAHPDDLVLHECLCAGMRVADRTRWRMRRGGEAVEINVSGRLASFSLALAPALAKEGMGIASIIPRAFRNELETGQLVPVLPDWAFEPLSLSALMPNRLMPAKTRVFLEFFSQKIGLLARELTGPVTLPRQKDGDGSRRLRHG